MMEIGCGLTAVAVVLAIIFGGMELLIHHHGGGLVPYWLTFLWWPCVLINFWEARPESGGKRSARAAAFLRGFGQLIFIAIFFIHDWTLIVAGILISFPLIFVIPQIVEHVIKRWD